MVKVFRGPEESSRAIFRLWTGGEADELASEEGGATEVVAGSEEDAIADGPAAEAGAAICEAGTSGQDSSVESPSRVATAMLRGEGESAEPAMGAGG